MSTILETIKEYLVSLGFAVDNNSYKQTEKAVASLEKGVTSFASAAVKTFGEAAIAVAAFGVAAATASAKFLNGLANQQIQMQILSRQLWTTEQQANAFNATLKAMGTNLQDLYLSPTLMSQYQQLHAVANQLSTPGDYNQQIQQLQNLKLQFEQMRIEAYYSLQWIGYWFVKYMQGPITKVHSILQQINRVIIKQMPAWTKQAAQWMASFWQAGLQIVTGITNVYHWLQKLGSYIPGWAKGIAAALAVLSISNPFMLFVEGISAAILLWNDFQTYLKDPSKSAFPQLWAWVQKVNKALAGMKIGVTLGKDLHSVFNTLSTAFQKVEKFAVHLYDVFKANGTIKSYTSAVVSLWNAFKGVFSALGDVITGIGHLFGLFNNSKVQSGLTNFFQLLADMSIAAIKETAAAVSEVGGLVQIVGDALHGNWKAAGNVLQNMWTGQNLATAGIIPQSMVAGAKKPSVGPPSYPYMFQNSTSSSGSVKTSGASSKVTTVNAPLTITNNNYGNTNTTATNQQVTNHFNRLIHNFRPAY